MALLLLLLAFSVSSQAYDCGTINITGTWGFPLSPAKNCGFFFQFPAGSYVQMYLRATNVGIYDNVGIRYPIGNTRSQQATIPTFISNASYPISFYVDVSLDPFEDSKMQLEIQIQLFPNNLGKNVVQSYTLGRQKPSGLLYYEDMQAGGTYALKPDSKSNNIQAAYIDDNPALLIELWNVWIYANGNFLFSMYDLSYWDFLNPVLGEVSVYIAQQPSSLVGALVFNDYTNYWGMYQPQSLYVPVNLPGETNTFGIGNVFPDTTMDGAITFVGAKNGSTPFDVRTISTSNAAGNRPTNMTYLAGGIVANYSMGTRLQQSQLPFHVYGNLNTFYVTRGSGSIKITVRN